ncbi:NAALAD2 [Bugula neritina]|uniref:NAALAD2 n=1 Tax=Bugula neritina TaxID=10212 RepID=A0A7J7KNL0_BUGNE|nr:NAALAD2 [Bugula neritina]
MKTGWKPRRTIIFCSWDGEEYGIIGSIEWLDEVKVLVGERAVAYLNCDSGVVFNQVPRTGASPLLFRLMYDTAKLIDHPFPTSSVKTMYDEWLIRSANISDPNAKPRIGDLGSGSDHTGFYIDMELPAWIWFITTTRKRLKYRRTTLSTTPPMTLSIT